MEFCIAIDSNAMSEMSMEMRVHVEFVKVNSLRAYALDVEIKMSATRIMLCTLMNAGKKIAEEIVSICNRTRKTRRKVHCQEHN